MKRILIVCLLVVYGLGAKAQIELEHVFPFEVSGFNTESGYRFYYIFRYREKAEIIFYNQDYSVYRQVNVELSKDYVIGNLYLPSDKIFNTDNKIEFLLSATQINVPSPKTHMYLFNEEGEILETFENKRYARTISVGSVLKLILTYQSDTYQYEESVYSLPSKVTNTNARVLPASSNPAYPNPSTTIVNLPYKLELGSSSLMSIYSAGGSLIDQKQLDANIDRIMLDVSNYQPGVYMYEYNGITNRFVVK